MAVIYLEFMLRLSNDQYHRWNINTKICCIYIIENTLNQMVYVGQTTDLRKRVSSYHTAIQNNNKIGSLIIRIMKFFGEENFEFSILQECNADELNQLEVHYIKKYKSFDINYGYNVLKGGSARDHIDESRSKSFSHTGLKASSDSKRKRSNMVVAISEESFIIADSGKLLGDYLGTTKDLINNCLRNPSAYKGWCIYYSNSEKRDAIYVKMCKKNKRRSEKWMKYADMLTDLSYEGVETIYLFIKANFKKFIYLSYDIILDGRPCELELGFDSNINKLWYHDSSSNRLRLL